MRTCRRILPVSFLVLVLLCFSLFCFAEDPDPAAMTDEEILAELAEGTAWMEGALTAMEADREDREALRSDVRYLITLDQGQNQRLTVIESSLTSSNGETLVSLLEKAAGWHWTEFTVGVGAGVVVMVIGGLLVPRIIGGQ